MPMKKRTYRKKRKTKKKQSKKMIRYRNIPVNGFPDTYTTRMKFTHFITLNLSQAGATTGLQYFMNANSAYQPDGAVPPSTNQPRGYDQLSAIYDHYTVIGSKMRAYFDPQVDNFASTSMYVYSRLIDAKRAMPTVRDVCEDKRGKVKLLPAAGRMGTKAQPIINLKYSPYKFHGVARKDSIVNNPNFRASVNNLPTEDAFFEIGVITSEPTTVDPAPIRVRIDIEYITVFTEPKPLIAS